MSDNKPIMKMTNPEIEELIVKYELDRNQFITIKADGKEELNRSQVNNFMKMVDLAAGRMVKAQVDMADEPIQDLKPTKKLHKALSGMMCQITFYNSNENDLPYVQMALNGIALMVPREIETWIPKEFVDGVLNSAIATAMKMETFVDHKGETKIRYIPKQVPRVQYTIKDIKHIDVLKKEFDELKKNKK